MSASLSSPVAAVRHPGIADAIRPLIDLGERVAVVREILQHVEVGGVGHDGHQVRRRDLARVDELQRRLLRANLIGHGHAGEVEEQHQQAAVLVLDLAGFGRRDGVAAGLHAAAAGVRRRACGQRRGGQRRVVQPLEFEDFDLLRLAVFGDGEVRCLEILERLARSWPWPRRSPPPTAVGVEFEALAPALLGRGAV